MKQYFSASLVYVFLTLTSLLALSACNRPPLDAGKTADNRLSAADDSASKSKLTRPSEPEFAQADPGVLLLLVPDGNALSRAEITAWLDAASEIGVRLQPITDKQFMALGAKALKFGGLVLPDLLHTIVTSEVIDAVRAYTTAGGHVMLVYDFGVYALDGNQKPTYPIPKSRLSDLAGVDYVLYDELREKTTVVGPVVATRSTMRSLLVPPGKSMAYLPVNAPALNAPALTADNKVAADLPVAAFQAAPAGVRSLSGNQCAPAAPPGASELESYSGYLLGGLSYSSFVTKGQFRGQVLASSPKAGLVAGLSTQGKGQVLFVNLPLTYLKVMRTDALPMHGFLNYFARHVLSLARLAQVPNAVAGLTLNWHLDSFTAQRPTQMLEKLGIFSDGPFSIHMTAGPDAITDGDAKGWNLDNNPMAKDLLRRFVASGHEVGSHGGWNHDYYGLEANESNPEKFLPYLQKNADSVRRAVSHPLRRYLGFEDPAPQDVASVLLPVRRKIKSTIDRLLGPPLREYSPPVGNNPTWAMNWLEQQGIVAAYFGGHTGLGPTRHYRDGQLRNPGMWVLPVTPAGNYATFEEFQTHNVPKQQITAWYHDSVDFVIAQDTTRMIYMHPNGANVWPDVLQDLLAYAKAQGKAKFQWYTMTRLADFMTARDGVKWTEQRDEAGISNFEITHPNSLEEMVWLLPKSRYFQTPVSVDGSVKVVDRGTDWAIHAGPTRSARFTARTQQLAACTRMG